MSDRTASLGPLSGSLVSEELGETVVRTSTSTITPPQSSAEYGLELNFWELYCQLYNLVHFYVYYYI